MTFGYIAATLALVLGAWGIWRDIAAWRRGRKNGR